MAEAVRVTGLREFRKAVGQVDAELPKAVRIALNAAAETVVDAAVPDIPRESGDAARSVKPRSTGTAVRVVAGGNKAPYYPWLDFGGGVGRNKSVRRKFYSDGRYLYIAYYDKRASGEFEEIMLSGLTEIARAAGLELS